MYICLEFFMLDKKKIAFASKKVSFVPNFTYICTYVGEVCDVSKWPIVIWKVIKDYVSVKITIWRLII
jgi:hypothetical protein